MAYSGAVERGADRGLSIERDGAGLTSLARGAFLVMVGSALLGPIAIGQGPAVTKSIFWEPYTYDVHTLALFHFDGGRGLSLDEILEENDANDLARGTRRPADGCQTAANAALRGDPLPLLGECEEDPEGGRFGGGLRFKGSNGRVVVNGSPGRGWTLEAWFKPLRLPHAGATLLDLPSGTQPVRVTLMADGRLAVQGIRAKEPDVTEWRATPGEWFHLALVWRPAAFHGENVTRGELFVLVNGQPLLRSGVQPAVMFQRTLAQPVVVGNDALGQSGFDGWIDELRVSQIGREFYSCDLGWTDNEGIVQRPEGRPFFRDERDVLLHLGFDRTLKPLTAPDELVFPEVGLEVLEESVEPRRGRGSFGVGVRRDALLLRPDGLETYYEGRGFARSEQGTLAFWVRPLNWDNFTLWFPMGGVDQKRIPLFRMYQEGQKEAVLSFSFVQTPDETVRHRLDLHPGRWVHLAMVWKGAHTTWYSDGKPWPHGGSFICSRKSWTASQPLKLVFHPEAGCAIDDFRIYPRPLAPMEIRNLAALYDRRVQLEPLPCVEMKVAWNGVIGYVDVELYPLHPDYRRATGAQVCVTAVGAEVSLAIRTYDLAGNPWLRDRLATGPMDFGAYEVTARFFDAGHTMLFEDRFRFTREPPPWWRNSIGISDRVMPGWMPITVRPLPCKDLPQAENGDPTAHTSTGTDGAVFGVALRDIHLGASGLPEQVIARGEPILAGPVALIATVGERTEALKPLPGSLRVETRGEVRTDFMGRSEGLGVFADVQGYLEFDGMMWFEITLKSSVGHGGTLDRLSLRIPYSDKASTLLHWWSGPSWFRSRRHVWIGATPREEGVIFSSADKQKVNLLSADGWGHKAMDFRGSFIPYVMLTGDRYGMAWFGENDQGWTWSTEIPAVSIERKGDTVTLVLNVITETIPLDKPRSFAFGLHPIPVKELDRPWRYQPGIGVDPDSFCGFNLKGPRASTQFYLHPENMDWDAARSRHPQPGPERTPIAVPDALDPAAISRPGKRVRGLYLPLIYQAPVFPDHTREWSEVFIAQRYTPELVDYSVWIWNEWVKRGLADGLYFDECWNAPVTNWPSPVTYRRDDGGVQPGWHFRLIRERLKRMRQIFHDFGLTPVMTGHSTHTFFIPYHSFFDTVLDGEHYFMDDPIVAMKQGQNLMQFWPPDRLRFNNSEKWGIVNAGMFMGPLPGPWKERWVPFKQLRWRQARAFTAMMLLNDLLGYHDAWGHYATGGGINLDDAWLRECRIREDPTIDFVGYWDEATPATHIHTNLYVSAWKRNGWCLAVLVNYGAERIEAQVSFDPAKMGLGGVEPSAIHVRDVDRGLIQYFDNDVTLLELPKGPGFVDRNGDDSLADLTLEEPLDTEQRRGADPDAAFEWKDGLLRAPVRAYDFRLFEFTKK